MTTSLPSTRFGKAFPRFCLFVLALASAGVLPALGNTTTVTNTNDSGPGSLRQAIADAAASGSTINFSSSQITYPATIKLSSTLSICNLQNLTISGPGASQLAISGNGAVQVLNICNSTSVTISGLTIENGYVGSSDSGGGISNSGTLTITDSALSGNTAGLTGGGIENYGTLIISRSTLSRNSVNGGSGSGNAGGGIANWLNATATITNCTLSGNSVLVQGGAIYNLGTLTVTNSTLSGNTTASYSQESGAGIGTEGGSVTLKSTLLAGNTAGNTTENCTGSMTSAGYNLSDDNTCGFSGPGDQNSVVPGAGLDPKGLQNNGGATQTIALLSGSPAVDAIPVASCTDTNNQPVATDQRGITRPQGKACDVGAYELIQAVPFSSFNPYLAIDTGRHPGFVMTSTFTLGSGTTGLQPANEAMTLKIANYTLTLPAGSFHKLGNTSNAPYAYEGTVNSANLVLGIVPLGRNTFSFDAAGAPVAFTGIKNPVTITLTFGSDSGTKPVNAAITMY